MAPMTAPPTITLRFDAGTLVHVLPEVVGQERPVRISVPAALSSLPKLKMIIEHVQRFVGEL